MPHRSTLQSSSPSPRRRPRPRPRQRVVRAVAPWPNTQAHTHAAIQTALHIKEIMASASSGDSPAWGKPDADSARVSPRHWPWVAASTGDYGNHQWIEILRRVTRSRAGVPAHLQSHDTRSRHLFRYACTAPIRGQERAMTSNIREHWWSYSRTGAKVSLHAPSRLAHTVHGGKEELDSHIYVGMD